jgi:hypothetical protein
LISREAGRVFLKKGTMAKYSELTVYKAPYDLSLAIFQFTKNFSKEHKYTVGLSLKKGMYNRPLWALVQETWANLRREEK